MERVQPACKGTELIALNKAAGLRYGGGRDALPSMTLRPRHVPLLLLTLLLAAPLRAEPPGPPEALERPERPRIGLVLSGGGARGLAHIGVLKVLEELRVPVDLVVGTSMGAVVGGAYASGRSTAELQDFVLRSDWDAILADRPPRQDLTLRRRIEDQLLPSRLELGLSRASGASLPPAAAGNSALEFTLESLVPDEIAEQPISQLRLPFRAIATDLLNGELIEMVDTPLFLAMRASMAVPGVFAPVRVNGRPVVDGGLVRNLGVDIARKMGAELIIAVNVGSPLLEAREITSAVGVANQMLQILTNQNVERSLRQLQPQDVLIDPDLGNLSFMDFTRQAEALDAGQRAAMAAHERLRALSLSPEAYAAQERLRRSAPGNLAKALPLASLSIEGAQRSNPEALRNELDLKAGQPISQAEINKAAAQLYGSGDFERVDSQVQDRDGQRHVTLHVAEADWARSRLRLGLELYSNFADANRFSLVAMHVATWLNAWGAELRSTGRIGAERGLGTQLMQPLGPGSPWHLSGTLAYQAGGSDLFDNGRRALRLASSSGSASLALGRNLGNWGEVELGVARTRSSVHVEIPADPALPESTATFQQQFAQISVDTLDSLGFPSRGVLLNAQWQRYRRAEQQAHQFGALGLAAFRAGLWAGHLYGEWSHTDLGSTSPLGGFLRLSGTADQSLSGRSSALARVVMARRIGHMPIGLGGAVRAGFSMELGGVSPERTLPRLGELKLAGSGFLAVDTRFGPFYLAAGGTKGGGASLYLYLGPIW